jgi:hypothetical protein
MIKVVGHLLDYVARHLCAARTVEVSDRIAVVDAFESGEVASDIVDG